MTKEDWLTRTMGVQLRSIEQMNDEGKRTRQITCRLDIANNYVSESRFQRLRDKKARKRSEATWKSRLGLKTKQGCNLEFALDSGHACPLWQ